MKYKILNKLSLTCYLIVIALLTSCALTDDDSTSTIDVSVDYLKVRSDLSAEQKNNFKDITEHCAYFHRSFN